MFSINRYEKVLCENCGTQTTKLNLARHKKSCSACTLYCTRCPNFSTKSKSGLIYHIAKKDSAPKAVVTLKCKLCYQECSGFYAERQHKNTQHGFPIKTANVHLDDIINAVDEANLKVELRSGRHFFVDSELERARPKVFNYVAENLNAIVDEKLDQFFNNLKCAAKMNLTFGFFMKNIEDGGFTNF